MPAAYGGQDCGFHRPGGRVPRNPQMPSPAVGGPCQTRPMPLATYKDLCIDVSDGRVSGEYWATMLGWSLEMHDDGDGHLRDGSGNIQVWLNLVPEPKSVKNRVH